VAFEEGIVAGCAKVSEVRTSGREGVNELDLSLSKCVLYKSLGA